MLTLDVEVSTAAKPAAAFDGKRRRSGESKECPETGSEKGQRARQVGRRTEEEGTQEEGKTCEEGRGRRNEEGRLEDAGGRREG